MRLRLFSKGTIVALTLILALGAFSVHAHEFGSSDDGCLCSCASSPSPGGAATNSIDQPHAAARSAIPYPVFPPAPPAAAAVLRRGPPVSIA